MQQIDYEFIHKYTREVLSASGYESPTSGETVTFTPMKKIVYIYLIDEMFRGSEFSIGQDKLAEALVLERKTVIKVLTEFLKDGVLEGEKKKQMGGFKQYVYTSLVIPLSLSFEAKQKNKPQARNSISPRKRFTVFRNSNFCCNYCGKLSSRETSLVVDHIIPVAKGGTDDIENLVACCEECNQGKSDMLI